MLAVVLHVWSSAAAASACCWCDDETPKDAASIVGSNGKTYDLIFSDEFNTKGRTFANGEDSKWTALKIGDTSNKGTAFYLPEQAKIDVDTNVTGKPVTGLVIVTENASFTGESPTGEKGIHMPYRSAMLQTWNKVRRRQLAPPCARVIATGSGARRAAYLSGDVPSRGWAPAPRSSASRAASWSGAPGSRAAVATGPRSGSLATSAAPSIRTRTRACGRGRTTSAMPTLCFRAPTRRSASRRATTTT